MYSSKTSFIFLVNVFRLAKAPARNIGNSKRLINTAALSEIASDDSLCRRQNLMPERKAQCSLNGVASLTSQSRQCFYGCNPVSKRRFSTRSDPNLSFEEFRDLLNSDDIQVIDVREPEELEADGRIPKAVNIPLGKLKKNLLMDDTAFMEKYKIVKPQQYDPNIVFVGLGPIKSSAALAIANKIGFKHDVASALALPPHKFQTKYSIDISDPETVPIVFSCKAGSRSLAALQKARELGFNNARHFGGGFLEWSQRMKSEE